jgi:hypothetical protein
MVNFEEVTYQVLHDRIFISLMCNSEGELARAECLRGLTLPFSVALDD